MNRQVPFPDWHFGVFHHSTYQHRNLVMTLRALRQISAINLAEARTAAFRANEQLALSAESSFEQVSFALLIRAKASHKFD
jgi:hypothetical protein